MRKALVLTISLCFALGMVMLGGAGIASAGDTIELKIAHGFSPKHTMQTQVLQPWAKKITEATKGRVKFSFFAGGALGKMPDHYSLAEKGLADIVYILQDYTPGRFPLTTVWEIPFMVPSATKTSVAMWKLYEQFPEFQKEYDKVKPLALFCHPGGDFHMVKKPIKTLEDFKGVKMRTANPSVTKALKMLGAVPVTMPVTETYTALERGVVDGTVLPWEGIFIFKLADLVKYATPTSFYTMTMAFLMNKAKWDSLPDDIKKIMEPEIGLSLSQWAGKVYDDTNEPMKQRCLAKGEKVVDMDPAVLAKLKEVTSPLRAEWVKEMNEKGLPGQAVLDAATAAIK